MLAYARRTWAATDQWDLVADVVTLFKCNDQVVLGQYQDSRLPFLLAQFEDSVALEPLILGRDLAECEIVIVVVSVGEVGAIGAYSSQGMYLWQMP